MKTALCFLLPTASTRRAFLPRFSFSNAGGLGRRDAGTASEGARRTPTRAGPSTHRRFGAGSGWLGAGSREPGGVCSGLRFPTAPSYRPAGHPQSHPMGARSPRTGSAATPPCGEGGRRGRGYLGVGWQHWGGLWVPGPAGRSSSVVLAGASPVFPHFQDLAFKAVVATWVAGRGGGGRSCKKPPNLLVLLTEMQELAIELRKSVAKPAAATTAGLTGVLEPRLGLPHRIPSGAAALPAVTSLPANTQRGKSHPLSLQRMWYAGIPHPPCARSGCRISTSITQPDSAPHAAGQYAGSLRHPQPVPTRMATPVLASTSQDGNDKARRRQGRLRDTPHS